MTAWAHPRPVGGFLARSQAVVLGCVLLFALTAEAQFTNVTGTAGLGTAAGLTIATATLAAAVLSQGTYMMAAAAAAAGASTAGAVAASRLGPAGAIVGALIVIGIAIDNFVKIMTAESKLKKAQKAGTEVIDEAQLRVLIEG